MNTQATDTYGQPVRRSSTKLSLFRFFLYLLTLISAIVTLILAAVLIATQRRHFHSYNKAAAELLATSILTLLILVPLHGFFHRSRPAHVISSTLLELVTLFVLWALFLGGAAALSHDFRHARCFGTDLCNQSRALRAFAWITFGFLSALLPLVLATAFQARRAKHNAVWRDDFTSNAGERSSTLPAGQRTAGEKVAQPAAAGVA